MRFCCLGSGSKGNATLVEFGASLLLIDNGFSVKYIEAQCAQRQIDIHRLKAILVTHEHSDHSQGVSALARKYKLPIYATSGTLRSPKFDRIRCEANIIRCGEQLSFTCESSNVSALVDVVSVPHDSFEACQFVFTSESLRLGVLTDLGSISSHVAQSFSNLDALLLEANHDPVMLREGPYPPSLKARVASSWGHLSNQQALEFALTLNLERLNTLVLGHISEKNNHLELVKQNFSSLEANIHNLHYALQDSGFDWFDLKVNELEVS